MLAFCPSLKLFVKSIRQILNVQNGHASFLHMSSIMEEKAPPKQERLAATTDEAGTLLTAETCPSVTPAKATFIPHITFLISYDRERSKARRRARQRPHTMTRGGSDYSNPQISSYQSCAADRRALGDQRGVGCGALGCRQPGRKKMDSSLQHRAISGALAHSSRRSGAGRCCLAAADGKRKGRLFASGSSDFEQCRADLSVRDFT